MSSPEHSTRDELLGTWRLDAAYLIAQETGIRDNLYGEAPRGRLLFEPGGRMAALLVSSERGPETTDAGRSSLFQSMMAYSGPYSTDGERFTVQVDLAWEPAWEGSEQVRYYTLAEGKLSIRSAPVDLPSFPGQKVVAYLEWTREGLTLIGAV